MALSIKIISNEIIEHYNWVLRRFKWENNKFINDFRKIIAKRHSK